ncbi:hypothetical protein TNCV_3671001 [Trichonephila clavipes]|nr:hypothetical protein TNCV_3671001 [Trichonephila clavipes]
MWPVAPYCCNHKLDSAPPLAQKVFNHYSVSNWRVDTDGSSAKLYLTVFYVRHQQGFAEYFDGYIFQDGQPLNPVP